MVPNGWGHDGPINSAIISTLILAAGNTRTGSYIYSRNCTHMCHGSVGIGINFGDAENPEYVGTVAYNNPWEFIHKVRNGQPGTRMPSAIINDWSENDILDLLTFARTLPKDPSEIGWWGRFREGMGHRGMMHGDYRPGSGRGFGPSLECWNDGSCPIMPWGRIPLVFDNKLKLRVFG